jgi:hypothetical protein
MAGQEHRSSGGSWVSQADRARWQRRAARELLKILAECADLPAIEWAIMPGGHLIGRVHGRADRDGGRAAFMAWRVALRIDQVQEVLSGDGGRTYLRASASCDGVRVTITATVAGPVDPARAAGPPGISG